MKFEIIQNSNFTDNVAQDNGGGICIFNSKPLLKKLQIINNYAGF